MSRRGLFLFILVGFLWGIPYLFIKVAVDPENGFSPATVVFLRTAIGAAILIPIAIKQRQLFAAVRGWRYVGAYALLEMIGPWILIGTAEQKISSGLAGLLVASVPIWATIFASMRGDKTVWQRKRLFGIVVGFIGLIAVVGIESITGSADPLSIAMVLVASIGYSYAVMMVQSALPHVSGIAINAVAMAMTAIFYLAMEHRAVANPRDFSRSNPRNYRSGRIVDRRCICSLLHIGKYHRRCPRISGDIPQHRICRCSWSGNSQ